ncbi:hypothetical protein [Spirosoma harenae]
MNRSLKIDFITTATWLAGTLLALVIDYELCRLGIQTFFMLNR